MLQALSLFEYSSASQNKQQTMSRLHPNDDDPHYTDHNIHSQYNYNFIRDKSQTNSFNPEVNIKSVAQKYSNWENILLAHQQYVTDIFTAIEPKAWALPCVPLLSKPITGVFTQIDRMSLFLALQNFAKMTKFEFFRRSKLFAQNGEWASIAQYCCNFLNSINVQV
jgi:hypothetical protein